MPARQQARARAKHPRLRIDSLGPLRGATVELAPLTILTGPPAQGKTYILNALFSELFPSDVNLVAACLFRGRRGDTLKVAEALYKEEVIGIELEGLDLVDSTLRVDRFSICVDVRRGRGKLERCLEGWLYPRGSRFRLLLPGMRSKLITSIVSVMEATLLREGFEARGRGRLCISIENVAVTLPPREAEAARPLVRLIQSGEPGFASYAKWVLATTLLSSKAAKAHAGLAELRARLKRVRDGLQRVSEDYAVYRPVYAWIGRGLVAMAALEPRLGEVLEGLGLAGLGVTAFLPVYSFVQAVLEGAGLLSTPKAPAELGLILELAQPVLLHRLEKGRNTVYLDVGGRAVPLRMAHGSAISLVGLALAAAPLLARGSGFLLVDEVEHLLHPTGQALAGVLLLALSGAGLTVAASTHSLAVTTVVSVIAGAEPGERACLIEELYKALGWDPPSREAVELVARGAERGAMVYVVDGGGVRAAERPDVWVEKLSDPWQALAAWASGACSGRGGPS